MFEIIVGLLLETELLEGGQGRELGPDAVIRGAQTNAPFRKSAQHPRGNGQTMETRRT